MITACPCHTDWFWHTVKKWFHPERIRDVLEGWQKCSLFSLFVMDSKIFATMHADFVSNLKKGNKEGNIHFSKMLSFSVTAGHDRLWANSWFTCFFDEKWINRTQKITWLVYFTGLGNMFSWAYPIWMKNNHSSSKNIKIMKVILNVSIPGIML